MTQCICKGCMLNVWACVAADANRALPHRQPRGRLRANPLGVSPIPTSPTSQRRRRSPSTSTASASSLCTLPAAASSTSMALLVRPPSFYRPLPTAIVAAFLIYLKCACLASSWLSRVYAGFAFRQAEGQAGCALMVWVWQLFRGMAAQDDHDSGRLAEPHYCGGHGPVPAHLRQRLEGRLPRRCHLPQRGAPAGSPPGPHSRADERYLPPIKGPLGAVQSGLAWRGNFQTEWQPVLVWVARHSSQQAAC